MDTATLSSKGQLVIPRQVRDLAHLVAGDEFAVNYVQGEIRLRPLNRAKTTTIDDVTSGQTAAAFGGFNKIEFGGKDGVRVVPLAIAPETLAAAIAPVAGTIAIDESKPKRPVPVIHFHGTKDTLVPFEMAKGKTPAFMKLKGVEDSIQTWVKLNGCDEKPKTETPSKDGDDMKVTKNQ